jgi:uncharacterized protein YndB with AHSA1/START domain
MLLEIERMIDAPPEIVWMHVTDPERMNAWSGARITLLAKGDGGRAGGVGAMRRVDIRALGRDTRLVEVIQSSEPPHRYVYRVVESPALSDHRGEIRLESAPGGTRLVWTVEYRMRTPGLASLAKRLLDRQLRKSLDRLASAAPSWSRDAVPGYESPGAIDPPEIEPELWRTAERIHKEQRSIADQLDRRADNKRWFARVYQYVTEEQLEGLRRGRVVHVSWVLRLIPRFHDYYAVNLRRRLGEERGECEAHWRAAFDTMDSKRDLRLALFLGLLKGVRAHIEEDLPRALAEIYVRHYAARCDYARFRADYALMGDVFKRASERLMREVPARFRPWYTRGAGAWIPGDVQEGIRRRRFYDVPKKRMLAFDRGERLARLIQGDALMSAAERSP